MSGTLDGIRELLRKGEKEKAYQILKNKKFLVQELINEGAYFSVDFDFDLSIGFLDLAERIAEDKIVKRDAKKNLAKVYYNRGLYFYNLKQFERAIMDFGKSLELNPNDVDAYFIRGNAYYKIKEYGRVIEDYNGGIELVPNLASSYNNRGLAYHGKGENDKAIKDYEKAIELNPNLAEAYNHRGIVYTDLGQFNRALKDFNKAIELNLVEAYNNRGLVYAYLGQFDRALKDFNKTIKLNPNFAQAYNNRGWMNIELKHFEKAIEDCNKAMELNLNVAEVYYNRGLAYIKLAKFEKALEDYNKAIDLNPSDAIAYNNRGCAYRGLSQFERAIEDYNKAIELNPNDAVAYENLGTAYLITNKDLDEAVNNFKKAKKIFEGKEKEKMLAYIEWTKARREMNNKCWDRFRERMKETKEILKSVGDPLAYPITHFIEVSYIDEKLDEALAIQDPKNAAEKILEILKNLPNLETGLLYPESMIFNARIGSFGILYNFLNFMLSINENTDLEEIKNNLTELCEHSKRVEIAFESVNFIIGKRAIVDIEDIICRNGIETVEEIKNSSKELRKEIAMKRLVSFWGRLSPAIEALNGKSSRETQNILLQRMYKTLREAKKGIDELGEDHKEILKVIHETRDILIRKDIINAKYIIDIPPFSPQKVVIEIPLGSLTDKQVKEVISRFKNLTEKGKSAFIEGIEKIRSEIDEKLIKGLKSYFHPSQS